ncbi:HEAT repeat domain-containing protein [Kitasatospora sp. cg17-2]
MINNLDDVDWSSMSHAYGSAGEVPLWLERMASPDPEVREKAFSSFYSAAHHQGDVYRCTTASIPYLFALADDPRTPDRAAVLALLLSIGRAALDRDPEGIYCSPAGDMTRPYAETVPRMRERAAAFERYAADPDPRVRRAAVPALGLFLDDTDRAFALLREQLAAESGTAERLLVVEAAAELARRLPTALDPVTTWLTDLATEPSLDADIRLAALVHRAASTPETIGTDLVPTATALLHQLAPEPEEEPDAEPTACGQCAACTAAATEPAPNPTVPPQLAAVFADLDRHGRTHAPTTELLTTLHHVLDDRVAERTALLTAQLTHPDRATRHDAIPMAKNLIHTWRGDHTHLVHLLADQLRPHDPYTTAEAAETLGQLPPTLAEPARQTLATLVEAHRTTHGPTVWASPHPLLRRAHQNAVTALAHLGDQRALPDLLTALDTGADAWRAIAAAGHLPRAADELLPRLTRRLADADLTQDWTWSEACTLIAALRRLNHPAAVPALADTLTTCVRQDQRRGTVAVLDLLAGFGTDAASALESARPLADAEDPELRLAATQLLWAAEHDPADAVPRLTGLLDTHKQSGAVDALGRIGAPAAAALPALRALLQDGYEWTRLHAAAAIHEIAGPTESQTVVPVLLEVWEKNDATSGSVLECLLRMGPAAAPVLPRIREELTRVRRSGRNIGGIDEDEALQHTARAIIERLA